MCGISDKTILCSKQTQLLMPVSNWEMKSKRKFRSPFVCSQDVPTIELKSEPLNLHKKWLKWLLCYDKVTVHYLHFGLDEILLFSLAKFDPWQCSKPQNSESSIPHSRSQSNSCIDKLFYMQSQLPIINHKLGQIIRRR